MNTRKIFAALVLAAFTAAAQNPNTAVYPAALATDSNLLVAANNAHGVLSGAITAATTSINFTTAAFPIPSAISIDNEIIRCTSRVGTTYTCTRAYDGTTQAAHSDQATAHGNFIAGGQNQLAAEVKAIESTLGINLANIAASIATAQAAAQAGAIAASAVTIATAQAAAQAGAIALSAQRASNLSDLGSATTAKSNLGLAAIASSGSAGDLSTGIIPLARFPTLNQSTTGTAAALAANGTNCTAGSYPLGVDAAGNAEGCTAIVGYTAAVISLSGTASVTAGQNFELIKADATAAAFNVTLPTAVGNTGSQFCLKKIDASANAPSFATVSAQTIDGAATMPVARRYDTVCVISDNANWLIY